jgi:hypothetical protein
MTKHRSKISALSHEMKFYIDHYDEVDAVLDKKDVRSEYDTLLKRVRQRFEEDFEDLFSDIKNAINNGGQKLFEIKWGRLDWDQWEWRGPIRFLRWKKREIGSVGLYLDSNAALVGWAYPKGGIESRQKLAVDCAQKVSGVHFTGYKRKLYPDWNTKEDGVIWLREKVANIPRADLIKRIEKRTNEFFRVAKQKWPR